MQIPVSNIKVLLEPSLAHLLIFCVWLFLHSTVELSSHSVDHKPTKSQTLASWLFTENVCEPGSQ